MMSHKVIWNQRGDELSLFLKFLIIKMYQFHKKNDEVYFLQNSTEQELSVEIIWNAESNRKMGK